ncbi:hypothetical protein C8Q80DRAFT_424724 [Daedaleopsis nitida]|nr:hypothetical protein C8Q80DRAFT_424724 [Daedaleopsis nitida]
MARAANPYSNGRMKTNLHSRPGVGGGFDGGGNRTAAQTLLNSNARPGTARYIPQSNGVKRQKTAHQPEQQSKYFLSGRPDSVSTKGKRRAQTVSEAETLTVSSDEDVGEPLKRELQARPPQGGGGDGDGEESDDPLNLIDQSSDCQVVPKPPHDFDKPSTNNPSRLPPDGASTRRLQQKQQAHAKSEPEAPAEVIVVDGEPSSDVESISSDSDADDRKPRFKTPNGRAEIRPGLVGEKVKIFDPTSNSKPNSNPKSNSKPLQRGKLDMQPGPPPFLDFKPPKPPGGRISKMQKKDAKLQVSQPTLSQFGHTPPEEQLDYIATSSSGFKRESAIPDRLPIEAWTFGCELYESKDLDPVHWLGYYKTSRSPMLKIFKHSADKTSAFDFLIDRDFDKLIVRLLLIPEQPLRRQPLTSLRT